MRRFRKKVRRFVRLYWFWVSLGLVLTKVSVEAAYIERGYKAYGGEWLVLPVVMIVGYFVNEASVSGGIHHRRRLDRFSQHRLKQ